MAANEALVTDQAATVTDSRGFIVDPVTGEVADVVAPREAFAVETLEDADWVLMKLGELESAIKAVDGNEAVIHARAIVANAEKAKKPLQASHSWFASRYKEEAKRLALRELDGQDVRSIVRPAGTISLRRIVGKLGFRKPVPSGSASQTAGAIAAALLAWAKKSCKDAIKTEETVQITKVPKPVAICVESIIRHDRAKSEAIAARERVDNPMIIVTDGKRDDVAMAAQAQKDKLQRVKAEVAFLEAEATMLKAQEEYPKVFKIAERPDTLALFDLPEDRDECYLETGV